MSADAIRARLAPNSGSINRTEKKFIFLFT